MKFFTPIIIFIFFVLKVSAQDTTKILFIGNSFTGANNLYLIVKDFIASNGTPVYTYAYTPGGISVSELSQGNLAHMNNPYVFDLIRNTDWDALVLQDKQGQFVGDSAVFPATSMVIEGHLRIRDSLHFYHPCAKMIWFSGWGLKNGTPPQWPTGIDMIDHITVNYRVLNDTAKDIIAPIGLAWKRVINNNPGIDLWVSDLEHPSASGSFLTAAILYGVITGMNPGVNNYQYTLSFPDASYLKNAAQETLTDTIIRRKSNLKGIEAIPLSFVFPDLQGPPGMQIYQWWLGQNMVVTTTIPAFTPTISGDYRVWTRDDAGYWKKSCRVPVSITTSKEDQSSHSISLIIYPNPARDDISVEWFSPTQVPVTSLEIYSSLGAKVMEINTPSQKLQHNINIEALTPGMHLVVAKNAQNILALAKFIIIR